MKKLISISLLLMMFVSIQAANKVEVYYFHFTRRCVTCQAVETETMKSIQKLYPVQYKKGLISFKSINLDESSSATLAGKCKAEGQALLVISGGKRIDLTEKGFMYAKSKPAKLNEELKKVIDSFIK